MPEGVVLSRGQLLGVHSDSRCPQYGNVLICNSHTFKLISLERCLRLDEQTANSTLCPLMKCPTSGPDAHLNTPEGLLFRTNQSKINVITQPTSPSSLKRGKAIEMETKGAEFLKWAADIKAVKVGQTVIYSPQEISPDSKILIKTKPMQLNLDLASVFDIPALGSAEIDRLIESHNQRLTSIEQTFEPSLTQIRNWASNKFKLPLWVKVSLGAIALCIVVSIINHVITSIKNILSKCRGLPVYETLHRAEYVPCDNPLRIPQITPHAHVSQLALPTVEYNNILRNGTTPA